MKYLMTLICILYLLCSANALAGWENTFGWIYNEVALSLAIDLDRNYVVSGYALECEPGPEYVYLIKVSSSGDSLWARKYGVGWGSSVALSNERGYILAACCERDIHTMYYCIVKTNPNGDTLWMNHYGYSLPDCASIIQTNDEGYISVWDTDPSSHDLFVVKIAESGDTIWTRSIGRGDNDYGYSISNTSDGGYIVVGRTDTVEAEYDVYAVKLDSSGFILWDRKYGDIGTDCAFFIDTTFDGNYIITGQTSLYYSTLFDVYLLKVNDDGDTLWTRKYGGDTQSDVGRCVRPTTDGGYIITGWTYSYGVGTPDSSNVYLIKTDSLGIMEWQRTFGGTGEDKGYSVAQTDDGGYIIAGLYDQGPHTDVYLIKTDSLGYTEIEETYSTRPEKIALEVYPNPFNSSITISLDFGSESRSVEQIGSGTAAAPEGAEIEIFDVNGRLVERIPPAPLNKGGAECNEAGGLFVWRLDENLTSGVYLVRAKLGSKNAFKRVVYLK